MIVLGLESSCDETSAAICIDGRIEAARIHTQEEHAVFGGVVPEIASRAHLRKIDRLAQQVLEDCDLTPADLDLIAVTDSPGLAGALLVGIGFTMGMHASRGIAVTGVDHLDGHIVSALLEHDIPFPFAALTVSGGHTTLYRVDDIGKKSPLVATVDDAAGEAFDKVGKLMGFPYPAGRLIDESAAACAGTGKDIRFPSPFIDEEGKRRFSFSGLKTAVRYHLESLTEAERLASRNLVCRSFQNTVVRGLLDASIAAMRDAGLERIAVVGGVAANTAMRQAFARHFGDHAFFPSPRWCTDNAAMIARCGYEYQSRNLLRRPGMRPTAPRSGRKDPAS